MLKFIAKRSKHILFKSTYFSLITVILCFCSNLNGQETMQIAGRVVDDKRNLVSNAQILLLPAECKECPLDVIESFTTNENGNFVANIQSKTKYHLFVEQEVPSTHWRAINSPSDTIRYLPKYRGIPIFFRRNPKSYLTDLGILKSTIQYIKTEIDLQKFFVKENVDRQEYAKVKIQTKDYNGRIVGRKRNIDKNYWIDSSKIRLALPKGNWILDVFIDESGKERKLGSIKLLLQSETNVSNIYLTNRIYKPTIR